MKRLAKPFLIFTAFQIVSLIFGRILRKRYLRQEVSEDEVNAVGVMGGAKEKVTTRAFRGGYVRAVMGGVDLDLSEAAIEAPPATIEVTVIMGGAEIKVPQEWKVKTETRAIVGGVQAMRGREKSSEETAPDLVITGKVIMGGLAVNCK
ncbi:MAG: LiaF domain-containing protein [Chloroflexota bacterium]